MFILCNTLTYGSKHHLTGCDDEIQKLFRFCPSPEICSKTNMNKIGEVEVLFSEVMTIFGVYCVLFCFAMTKMYLVLCNNYLKSMAQIQANDAPLPGLGFCSIPLSNVVFQAAAAFQKLAYNAQRLHFLPSANQNEHPSSNDTDRLLVPNEVSFEPLQ